MNPRLAVLAAVAVGVGSALTALPDEGQVEPSPRAGAGAGDQPNRTFHLTARDPAVDEVLFSTRPNVTGSVAGDHPLFEASSPDRPVNGTYSTWPTVFRSVFPLLRDVPEGARLRLEGVSLADAATSVREIDASASIPLAGSMDRSRARSLWGPSRPGSLKMFLGFVPVEILETGESQVRYRILDGELPDRADVPRAAGLHVDVDRSGASVTFSLDAPRGLFTVGSSCGTLGDTLPSGTYEVLGRDDGDLRLRRYRNGLDYALDGRNVSLTVAEVGT